MARVEDMTKNKNIKCYSGMKYTIKGKEYTIPELKFTDDQYHIDQKVLDGLYDLLKIMLELCEKKRIKIFPVAGTLISVIRHKAFMPWDDDIDMGYHFYDHQRLLKLKTRLLLKGYNMIECGPGIVVQKIDNPIVAMDLFLTALCYDGNYRYGNPIRRGIPTFMVSLYWPKEYYLPEEVEASELEKRTICDLEVYVPKNPEEVLKRSYAPSVLNEVRGVASSKAHLFRPIQPILPIYEKFAPDVIQFYLNKKMLM